MILVQCPGIQIRYFFRCPRFSLTGGYLRLEPTKNHAPYQVLVTGELSTPPDSNYTWGVLLTNYNVKLLFFPLTLVQLLCTHYTYIQTDIAVLNTSICKWLHVYIYINDYMMLTYVSISLLFTFIDIPLVY